MLMLLLSLAGAVAQDNPKREFRGAWLHIIGQSQYAKMSNDEMQDYLVHQLDELQYAGVNAIIWQIRPQADAAYTSDLEPWSRWITGKAGKAPAPLWDPLQWMIDECHKRGMELHAWINPYRVTTNKTEVPAKGHIYHEHPEWFIKYADGKIYFDPGLPESRNFIDKVVRDIITRYDVDAIHMDDYFYPYPVDGATFHDEKSYAKYGQGFSDKGDWRRHNVDLLIEQLHNTLQELKPWVQLGISPFGIWRNKKNDPTGSNTNGLQCYDALYADCPKWTREGWVDYMIPQLYWALDHKAASVLELEHWWNGVANGRNMYYGLAVRNCMDVRDIAADGGNTANPTQLRHKVELSRSLPNVHGITWWPGYDVTKNYKSVQDTLATQLMHRPSLIPAYTWMDSTAPQAVEQLGADGSRLTWQPAATTDPRQQAVRYAVYAFGAGERVDIENGNALVGLTGETSFKLRKLPAGTATVAVTAIDRANNESKPQLLGL